MKDNVYYSFGLFFQQTGEENDRLLNYPLINVIQDLSKDNNILSKSLQNQNYLKCPAASKYLKNTYVVKAPYDFVIDINPENGIPNNNIKGKLMNPETHLRDLPGKMYDLSLELFLFSPKSLEVSQIPATYHLNDFTRNTSVLMGRYDIGKWYRPLVPTIVVHKPYIKVNRGDALFYVKFYTNKKLKLKSHKMNTKLRKIARQCISLKHYQRGFNLNFMYNLFIRNKLNKKIIKEIKKNLIDY